MKLLAIDIGASSGRGILGEIAGGKISLREVHRFKNAMIDRDGHKFWDVHRLHKETVAALAKAPEAESVGIDTWGVDYGYVSKSGEVVGLPFAYRDSRTAPMVDRVHSLIPRETLYAINGQQVMSFNSIYQIAEDMMSRPDVLRDADRMQFMPDLLGRMLTGRYTAEYSIASTSGLLDARMRDWSSEILGALGVPRHLFGPITQPGGFQAPLAPEVAKATGSKAVFTLAAGHDTASAVAAVPMTWHGHPGRESRAGSPCHEEPDAMYISSGTWSLVGMELDQPVLTKAAQEANFTNEGGVGGKIRFLRNVMGLWLIQELQRIWAERGSTPLTGAGPTRLAGAGSTGLTEAASAGQPLGFGEICSQAERAKPFAALINPQDHRFLAPKDMHHEIEEECRRTGQPVPEGVGPLARCVFESLALAYRDCVETLQRITGRTISRVHIVGGGVQNKLLCQMTADACGVPVFAGPIEATAIGNILVQAIAMGELSDIARGRELVRATFPLDEYRPRDRAAWEAAWRRYGAVSS